MRAKGDSIDKIAGFVRSTPEEVQRWSKEDEERKARIQAFINRLYIQNCEKCGMEIPPNTHSGRTNRIPPPLPRQLNLRHRTLDRPAATTETGNSSPPKACSIALEIALRAGIKPWLCFCCAMALIRISSRQSARLAFRIRRWDLLDLLLNWGADASLSDLFDTYNSTLYEPFRNRGVDLTAYHELAETLAYHSSNKPLFGYARRNREHDPRMQEELNNVLIVTQGRETRKASCCVFGRVPIRTPRP